MDRISSGTYACDTITRPEEFLGMKAEWDALQAKAPDSYVSESFTWASLCWQYAPRAQGRALCCLTLRDGRQLAAVWPLTISRTAAWRVATPLVASSEYCPFLADPQADPDDVWRTLCKALKHAGVDALRLLNVRRDGVLGRCLARHLPTGAELYATPTLSIGSSDIQDWNAYRARMSAKTRQTLNKHRRRFSEAAAVVFEEVTDPAERVAVWRWMLEHKRRWAAKRAVKNKWLFSESFEHFVAAGLDALGPSGARRLFVLRADGAPAAAELASVDRVRSESFMCVHDEAFADFSPANLLHEDCIRWAGERGLGYDMRLGAGAHKDSWATYTSEAASYCIPLTMHGRLYARCLRLAVALPRRRMGARAAALSAMGGDLIVRILDQAPEIWN
jgi:CelD/BcsL family acetyltransferase involved in cellulose biosynthesis